MSKLRTLAYFSKLFLENSIDFQKEKKKKQKKKKSKKKEEEEEEEED